MLGTILPHLTVHKRERTDEAVFRKQKREVISLCR
jgi:hypothetical protein